MKTSYTIKIEQGLLEKLKLLAEKENRAFNNYVETVLLFHVTAKAGKEKP